MSVEVNFLPFNPREKKTNAIKHYEGVNLL